MRTTIAVFKTNDGRWIKTYGVVSGNFSECERKISDRLYNGDTSAKHQEHAVRLPRRLGVNRQQKIVSVKDALSRYTCFYG